MQHFNSNYFFKLFFLLISTFTLLNAGTYSEETDSTTAEERSQPGEDHDKKVTIDLDYYHIGKHEHYEYLNGIRFQNVNIPKGTTITSAYLQFTSAKDLNETTNIIIQLEDIDNSSEFGDNDENISKRVRTSNKVEWNKIAEWKTDKTESEEKTPDLKDIIQEVINRDGWVEGNSLSIILTNGDSCENEDCLRYGDGKDGSSDIAPKLTIEYESDPIASVDDISVKEKTDEDVTLTFTIQLDKDAPTDGSTFKYSLTDGTAEKGTDYEVKSGETGEDENITIAEGEDSRTISITIKGEDVQEDDETFTITIEAVENLTIRDSEENATGTIEDDDTPTCTKSDTINLVMKNNNGDAEEYGDTVNKDSSKLEMMYNKDNDDKEQKIGMVFEGVNIQKDCYVKKAYIQFKSSSDRNNDTSVLIYGEDEDNASTYESKRKVTDVNTTDEFVEWGNIADWTSGQKDEKTRTTNVSCLVEHILHRENWEENNTMGFVLKPADSCVDETCVRKAYSGEGDSDERPVLHIEYSDDPADSRPCQIAVDDSYHVRMGSTITLDVTLNDASEIDDDSLEINATASHGGVSVDGNSIIYDQNESGYTGDDNLTYTVKVDGVVSNIATVRLNINLQGGDVKFYIVNPPKTRNIQGNYVLGGNTIVCKADSESVECENSTNGDNDYVKYIDIDGDTNTYNSSTFTLNIPENSTIIWAGLFWGGLIHNSTDGNDWKKDDKIDNADEYDGGPGLDLDSNNTHYDTDKVLFKIPSKTEYEEIDAKTLYYSKYAYSAFANITDYLKENNATKSSEAEGNYTLANLSINHKKINNHGNSGGWSMAVIYENEDSDYKNVSIYNGFIDLLEDNSVDMNVSGFLVPKTNGQVKAKLSFMALDSDGGTTHLKLNDEKLGFWIDEAGKEHDDTDKVFNSTIVGVPLKYPDFNLSDDTRDFYSAFELDTYDANDILHAGDTSANIKMDTLSDNALSIPLIIFSADMYSPRFCYDYAYKQEGKYFTEENNGTQRPRIVGHIDKDTPIDVEIYLRNNEDSDLQAVDFTVDVEDINISQAKYKEETTWKTKPNSSKRISIDDSDLNVSDELDYDKNISLDDMDSRDYFYFGYTLNPDVNDINISLNAYAKYNLIIGDKTIILPKIKLGNERINICSATGNYQVIRGIFNVVHKDYYDNDKYYNLPTQVTSRQGEFEVISLQKDSEELNNTITTIVAIDLINVDAYHDTMASCTELNNTLTSNKKWVIFNDADNGKVDFDKNVVDSDFYKMANKNTAFRISYHTDVNNSIITLTKDDDNYIINDYNKTFKDINKSSDCGSDGDSLTTTDLINCMKYIYGQRTSMVCSRDNFSLRPEAFSMKLYDQNQTDTTSKIAINGNNINISSGYNYFLEVNATNHQNSEYSPSYKTNIDANISWNSSKTGCNDESNITTPLTFKDGKIENNISVNQVGEYILSMIDTQWTKIDQNATHHQNDGNFSTEHIDCIENSNVVANTGTNGSDNTPLNGCNISSEHTNSEKSLEYKNYNLTLHPYSFKFNITTTYGLNNSIIDDNNKSYIYMTDMNYNNHQDKNNSVHINGEITASSYNDTKLSNFVKDCYAQDLNLSINKSNIIGTIAYKYLFSSFKSDGAIDRNISGDINYTSDTIAIIDDDFQKDLNGTIKTTLNLNFERNITRLANPESIRFRSYDVNNTTPFNANLKTDEFAKNSLDINKTLIHYYGRTHSARQRYNGNSGEAKIYYEVYCYGNDCNKSLLQDGTTSRRTNDLRWYINTVHDSSKDGAVGTVNEKVSSYITATTPSSSNPSKTTLTYDETQGMPYKSTMENNASYWLIYNKDDVNAETNEFKVEFGGGTTGWSGAHETNSTTKDHPATITNRRSMW